MSQHNTVHGFRCIKELSQNVKARAKTPYRFTLPYFTYGHTNLFAHKSTRNLAVFITSPVIIKSPALAEDSKPCHTRSLACNTFRSRYGLLPKLYFLVQRPERCRGISHRCTAERQFKAHTSRVQDDPIFGPVLRFVVQTRSPCTSVLFPVSLYVVLASCNSWDYLGCETRLVVGLLPRETHMMDLIVEAYMWG